MKDNNKISNDDGLEILAKLMEEFIEKYATSINLENLGNNEVIKTEEDN